ncbi:unnamed protein product [Closterium sp. NIES-64]|nr:unnamed protein product [Closterium sp. NIES-64]
MSVAPSSNPAPTVDDPLRVARCTYVCLMFSWPSQEDATAFRRLFPFTLKLPNSRPVLLKEFVDRFVAKAVGEPTLSIRNGLLEYAPEDIHVFLLDSTKPDGAHWLADLTNFHRAPDPYEGTYFTHLAGLPVATFDDPHSELIPSEILLKANKPPMLLNFSYHGLGPRPPPHSTCVCPLPPPPSLTTHLVPAVPLYHAFTPTIPLFPIPFLYLAPLAIGPSLTYPLTPYLQSLSALPHPCRKPSLSIHSPPAAIQLAPTPCTTLPMNPHSLPSPIPPLPPMTLPPPTIPEVGSPLSHKLTSHP